MPPLTATFRPEEKAEGEPVGPVVLTDPEDADFHEELETMPLSMARRLAEMNGWLFAED